MTNNILDEIYKGIVTIERDESSKGKIIIYYGLLQRDSIRAELREGFLHNVVAINEGEITHLFDYPAYYVAVESHLNVARMS